MQTDTGSFDFPVKLVAVAVIIACLALGLVGLVLPLTVLAAVVGGGIYVFYPAVLPPEVQDAGRNFEKKVTTVVEELPLAADDLLHRTK